MSGSKAPELSADLVAAVENADTEAVAKLLRAASFPDLAIIELLLAAGVVPGTARGGAVHLRR